MSANAPEEAPLLSDKLTPEQWSEIPDISRNILDDQYRNVPNEGIYHSLRHTYEVVRTGSLAILDPRLYELFGFNDSIKAYNNRYIDPAANNRLSYIAPVTSQAVRRAIQSISAPYLLSEEDTSDLYFCMGYALSMHDSVLWEEIPQANGKIDLQLVEDGAEEKSTEFGKHNLAIIYYDSDHPLHNELNETTYDKLTAFTEHAIPLTNSRGQSLQSEHLSNLAIYPFAREVKSIDLLGSYLGKPVDEVYDLLLSLANEKLTRPHDDLEADPTTLNMEALFNYPRNYICSEMVYGKERGEAILARFAELGLPLAGPIVIPDKANDIVREIVEANDPHHAALTPEQKTHLTWKEIQIALMDDRVRKLILDANPQENTQVQTINPT